MIIAPPQRLRTTSINEVRNQTGSLLPRKIAVGVASALLALAVQAEPLEIIVDFDGTDATKSPYQLTDGSTKTYDSLVIQHNVPAKWNQYTLSVKGNGSVLKINGSTYGRVNSSSADEGNNVGTYMIYSQQSEIYLNGDVDLAVFHNFDEQVESVGANLLYAREGGKIEIGTESSFSKMWVLAGQPDLISAKKGGQLIVHSTNNQFVGSIDVMDDVHNEHGASKISITFSGSDSYWVGDERSWFNSDQADAYLEQNDELDEIDLTFEDGAQWIYLGLHGNRKNDAGEIVSYAVPKRISSITLNGGLDGGIINLHDVNVKQFLTDIGLMERLQNTQYGLPADTVYDYVRIGDLKGSGGIFRMDLNGEDKTQSDMLYIEKGTGTHYFEPYNLTLLESITPENTLTFALVGQGSDLTFEDKRNLLGEALFDYELEIASQENITAEDIKANPYWDKTSEIVVPTDESISEEAAEKIDMSEFVGGTNWFIRRVTLTESAAAVGMTGAGYASYDAAVEMDRHDRRLAEQVRGTEESDNGLWVRVHHGRSGADNQYRWDRTGATVGFDRAITENNRLGAYFTYTQGDTEFLDVRGTGDMKRYELAVFDTLTLGAHYFDFVGRFGRVSSDYTVGNEAYSTSGDFDQDYAALSAEYGYHLKDENGVFIEPQMQIQVAYLDGFDYEASRGMQVNADSETSVIGRVGLRAGLDFEGTTAAGTLYARADVYHQFTDGQDALLSDRDGHRLAVNWGDTDTWAGIGVGTSWVWKNRFGLQLDVEKVMGGETDDTWLMSGRLNYLF